MKYLFYDLGVMLTMLDIPAADILTASDMDLVNKGGTSDMFAGLEMKKYRDCFQKPEMHYWQNTERGSNAEVDYLRVRGGKVLPVEVKANTQGSMQSLWIFMRKRKLHEAIRTSLDMTQADIKTWVNAGGGNISVTLSISQPTGSTHNILHVCSRRRSG